MRKIAQVVEFERLYIGSLFMAMIDLKSPALMHQYFEGIDKTMFTAHRHLVAYGFMQERINDGDDFDLAIVAEYVSEQTGDEEFAYFGDMARNAVSYASIRSYARIIRDEARKRNLLTIIDAQRQAISTCKNVDEAIEQSEKMMSDMLSNYQPPTTMRHFSEISKRYMQQVLEEQENPDKHQGIPSGFSGIDAMLGRKKLIRGSLCIVAGRPGMGKTAFMLSLLMACAKREGAGATIAYSQEMPNSQIFERLLKQETGLDDEIYEKHFEQYAQTMVQFNEQSKELPIFIDDKPRRSIDEIMQAARLMAKTRTVDMIFIDYVGIMKLPDGDRHDIKIGEITTRLKELAKELNCVVVALSQVNRNCESRNDKRPSMADLKDSGAIEQDADYVITLYRDEVYQEATPARGFAELLVRKNRHGKTGVAYAHFKDGVYLDCDQATAYQACSEPVQEEPRFKYAKKI